MLGGSDFQSWGAERLKAVLPMVQMFCKDALKHVTAQYVPFKHALYPLL